MSLDDSADPPANAPTLCMNMDAPACIAKTVTNKMATLPKDDWTAIVLEQILKAALAEAQAAPPTLHCCWHATLNGWYPWDSVTGWDTAHPCA